VPALDNGEWLWGVYATWSMALRLGWTDVATGLRSVMDRALAYAREVFFSPVEPGWRAVTKIKDATQPCVAESLDPPCADALFRPGPGQYSDGGGVLDDPYEGEV
jgi:hypothetical protein